MKLIKLTILFSVFLMTLSSCNNSDKGLQKISENDLQVFINDKKTGFVMITNQNESQLINGVNDLFLEKKKRLLVFNVFQNNGESENLDGLSRNPFRSSMPNVNAIYYVIDGTVQAQFDLNDYSFTSEDDQLEDFLTNMIERGYTNE